ncbi:hypothetical protein DRQ20_02085 [bacterium]|nr:MAG: hypothetical protein DRQ20_02085 [bacterium]
MKRSPLIFLIFLAFLPVKARKYMVEWMDTLDTGDNDHAYGIAIDNQGNIYVTGFSYNGSNYNYLTAKYDSAGNIIWIETLDNGSGDCAYGIAVDTEGYIYVTGGSYIGTDHDFLTIKYDFSGNIVWADTLDNGSSELAHDVVIDNNGNLYVTGYAEIGSIPRYFTAKYNSLGNLVWADTVSNGMVDEAWGIDMDAHGNVYVTGRSHNGIDNDYLTVKYDPSGNVLWIDIFDNGTEASAYDIAVDAWGNVYVAGRTSNGSNYDYLIVKYDPLGNVIWTKTWDNGGDDYAYGIAIDNQGNIFVTGGSYIGTHSCYLTVKYDSLGNILWMDTLEHGRIARDIAVDNKNNLYVTGYFYNGSNSDFLTVKYIPLKDAGILSIVSPDTACTGSLYIPQILVKNNSLFDTLTFDIIAIMDSTGSLIYTDLKNVYGLPPDNSVLVSFDPWVTPSTPVDVNLSFSIITPDMKPENDTLSKVLYVRDLEDTAPPVIDSAIAFDGINAFPGIDDDDYVILYFSEPTNKPLIDSSNIDNVLSLSGRHSWLDGSGNIGACAWNTEGDQLQINFTTDASLPTIAVGDTIIPDSSTITDINGNPCWSTVILRGSFDPEDLTPPVIDSAIAFDGTNALPGIDDDDYVILYFSEPTNKPSIDNTNIDTILPLSNGHSWLDGFGALGTCYWNPDGTQLLINLTTNLSPPTIAVGDTITPDSASIVDAYGNPCFSPVILLGSFESQGIRDEKTPERIVLNVEMINKGSICFSYGIAKPGTYSIYLYTIDGRVMKRIEGKESGYYQEQFVELPSGVYFLKLKQEDNTITRKVIVIE